jgi:hypothetical protein
MILYDAEHDLAGMLNIVARLGASVPDLFLSGSGVKGTYYDIIPQV